MDISVEYVMMCESSEDLQDVGNHREITQKDFVAIKETDIQKGIWLPRQDQIQELIMDMRLGNMGEDDDIIPSYDDLGSLVEDLHDTFVKNPFIISMEQAWLCMFMKEVYMKTWNVVAKKWEII